MRLVPLIPAALIVAAPLCAQDWLTTTVTEDGLRSNFPGEPTVEPIAYETEFRLTLPGRGYSAVLGRLIQLTNPDRSRTYVSIAVRPVRKRSRVSRRLRPSRRVVPLGAESAWKS